MNKDENTKIMPEGGKSNNLSTCSKSDRREKSGKFNNRSNPCNSPKTRNDDKPGKNEKTAKYGKLGKQEKSANPGTTENPSKTANAGNTHRRRKVGKSRPDRQFHFL